MLQIPSSRMRRWLPTLLVSVLVLGGFVSVSNAQWGRWGGVGEGNLPPRYPPASLPDRDFAFCKLMYDQVRYEELGMGWATDYPYAGINLMTRYSELTTGRVSWDERGEPNHWVVRITDDELFNCPFIMAADAGTIGFSPTEIERLREYLLKGGFRGTPTVGAPVQSRSPNAARPACPRSRRPTGSPTYHWITQCSEP